MRSVADKKKFDDRLVKAIKPHRCQCGKTYNNDYTGGFITNGVTFMWACSPKCAEIMRSKLY
jgi:hypothetical protein